MNPTSPETWTWAAFFAFLITIFGLNIYRIAVSALNNFVNKAIDLRSEAKIANLRGEIEARNSALKSSMDTLLMSQSATHPKAVEAISELWLMTLKIREFSATLIGIDAILTNEELAHAMSHPRGRGNEAVLSALQQYGQFLATHPRTLFTDNTIEKERLFVSDRLWLIFYVYRSFHGRIAYLASTSLEHNRFNSWRNDEPIKNIVSQVIQAQLIETIFQKKMGIISALSMNLEAEFLREARRILFGSKAMQDSFADLAAIKGLESATRDFFKRASTHETGQSGQ